MREFYYSKIIGDASSKIVLKFKFELNYCRFVLRTGKVSANQISRASTGKVKIEKIEPRSTVLAAVP